MRANRYNKYSSALKDKVHLGITELYLGIYVRFCVTDLQ